MRKAKASILCAAALLTLGSLATACQPQAPSPTPGDVLVKGEVRWTGSYQKDIQPIFDEYCVACHGPDSPANGLRLDSYEGIMKGTQYGRVVIPGQAGGSTLLRVLEPGAPPQIHMPHGNIRLSPNRIRNITLWIEAGASRS